MSRVHRPRYSLLVLALAACPADRRAPPDAAKGAEPAPGPQITPARPVEVIRRDGNHLVDEPSPYLEQHSHNPVDWYPWGEEALERAKRENKPIFLSIGYSTCHWCHVMEHESFEDDEVAQYLNEHFVSIKVDREQRPDVDSVYIDAVAALGARTGWPLTVFLTPELEPFYGGTYFPRHGSHGRPGFLEVLNEVQRMWTDQGAEAAKRGREVLAKIERQALAAGPADAELNADVLDASMVRLERARDTQNGGFGRKQKFPNSPLLLAELRYARRTGDAGAKSHLVFTLEQAMRGGIRDHLAGTFHRYAVDPNWHVPHFERMLYDNAQLAGVYLEAGRWLEREDFVEVARGILDDLIKNWQREDGGIIVGFDADDPEGEGAYYTWTPAELRTVLGNDDAEIVAAAYAVTDAGERLLEGRSVLHRQDDAEVAERLDVTVAKLHATIARAHPKMLAARSKRPPPAVDDKELVAWNGLAIMALADAGRWLKDARYVRAAERSATFILEHAWNDAVMSRGRRAGASLGEGFLDDHSFAGLGLLRLHAATGDPRWLLAAREIAAAMLSRFHDANGHAFYRTGAERAGSVAPIRRPDFEDNVLPSGGSAAILFALELGAIAGDKELYDAGYAALAALEPQIRRGPFSSGFLLVATDHATAEVREVVVAGAPGESAALWAEVEPTTFARILPVRVVADGAPEALAQAYPALKGKKALRGRPTAFVCEQGSCQQPTSDPARLRTQIAKVAYPD